MAQQKFNNSRFGLVNAFRAPEAAANSGAGWELITLRWDQLQPDGPSDWKAPKATDQWLNSARTDGREVVAELIGTPAWATDDKSGTGVPRGLYLPIDDPNNLWANFVRQTVSHYGVQGINHWVIWEAPDVPADSFGSLWGGTTEDYYQLVKVAYLVVKKSNTNAQIHLGGITDKNPIWFNRFLDIAIDDPTATAHDYYFDVVTVHIFFASDQIYTLTANPLYLLSKQGIPLKPVWINHTNARPGIDPQVYPEDSTLKKYSKITLEQQAAFIIHAYALGFAAGAERIAIYQLADDLAADGDQAFGLVRADGDPRPAFAAYQLAAQHFSGFRLARQVDEEAHPLVEYVRLTSSNKVTHIAWARTAQNATLTIPTRSSQANLYDLEGNQWLLKPEGGVYRVVVGGADCNDPATAGGCLIGGMPWILVEEGVKDPLNEAAPTVTVDPGGVPPTPDPGPMLTATAMAMPTLTPTVTDLPSEDSQPTEELTQSVAAVETLSMEEVTKPAATEEAPTLTPTPTILAGTDVGPKGFASVLPYLLIGLGVVIIGGGAWYFFVGPGQEKIGASYTAKTQEHHPPTFDEDPSTAETKTNLPKL
ncbi:MAG: hypothetical protein JXB07_15355 [Anaerolineae bacterium]|nr:hypothetical protein [Anaerolineae bacterium]